MTKNFLRFCWFPLVVFFAFTLFCGYQLWKSSQIINTVIEQSLIGNRYAIALLTKYEKLSNIDTRMIRGALEGNPYALEILKLNVNARIHENGHDMQPSLSANY